MNVNSTDFDHDVLHRDILINKVLIATAVASSVAALIAEFRAFDIGWTLRDGVQLSVVGSLILLAFIRKRIATHYKSVILVLIATIGGIPGTYTLGLLGGTILMFPLAAVIVSVFYSFRLCLIYVILTLCYCCFLAVEFCSDPTHMVYSADQLLANYMHWAVYIVCMVLFFTVMLVSIHNYRKAMKSMIDKISRQHDELKKINEELCSAKENVKILSGFLPICASCKKIRDDKGYWNQIESYIKEHSEADFSHSICPDCMKSLYPKEYESIKDKLQRNA